MKRTACFDFGNTRLKAAIFDGDDIKEVIILADDAVPTIEAFVQKHKPQNSILSSVINHNTEIEHTLAVNTQFHKLTNLTNANFTTPVGSPQTIGADRLAP